MNFDIRSHMHIAMLQITIPLLRCVVEQVDNQTGRNSEKENYPLCHHYTEEHLR